MTKTFVENSDGVHLMGALSGEYTLCGDSFDMAETSDGKYGEDMILRATKEKTITCPRCAEIVLACRGVRVGPTLRRE